MGLASPVTESRLVMSETVASLSLTNDVFVVLGVSLILRDDSTRLSRRALSRLELRLSDILPSLLSTSLALLSDRSIVMGLGGIGGLWVLLLLLFAVGLVGGGRGALGLAVDVAVTSAVGRAGGIGGGGGSLLLALLLVLLLLL